MFTVQWKRRGKTVCQNATLFLQASILISNAYTIELTSKGVGSHSPQLILSINLTQMEPIRQKTLFNCQWHRNHLINGIAVQQAMSGIVEG